MLEDDLSFQAISDRGFWLTGRLVLDGDLRPLALARLRGGRLLDGAGRPFASDAMADAESLIRLPEGGFVVGFERWHRLRRYAALGAPGVYVPEPPGLEQAPFNGGLEALALMPDGRWLAMAEQLAPAGAPGLRRAWIGGPAGWSALAWRPCLAGHVPTEARALPDGGLFVLERAFSITAGFSAALVHVPPAAVAAALAGGVLEGRLVLRLDDDAYGGNWEGLGLARHQGRQLVALMTDDNEQWRNATRLLLYAWAPG